MKDKSISNCLYIKDKNKCNALKLKECNKCSFYKEKTQDNINKFIIQVEKDIILYPKLLKK